MDNQGCEAGLTSPGGEGGVDHALGLEGNLKKTEHIGWRKAWGRDGFEQMIGQLFEQTQG